MRIKIILIDMLAMLYIRVRNALSIPFNIADIFPDMYIRGHRKHIFLSIMPAEVLLNANSHKNSPKKV